MGTRRHNQVQLNKGSRVSKPPLSRRQPVMDTNASTDRVVVIDTVHAAQDIIRISIETVKSARLPERVIMF
jgi:hypothetical protein